MSTGVALHWRLNAQRYRLVGSECLECGHKMFPPRAVCPACVADQARADVLDTIQIEPLAPETETAAPERRDRTRVHLAV
jgi:uncharacterized OB-fold protein